MYIVLQVSVMYDAIGQVRCTCGWGIKRNGVRGAIGDGIGGGTTSIRDSMG